jgi:hypothetical protein
MPKRTTAHAMRSLNSERRSALLLSFCYLIRLVGAEPGEAGCGSCRVGLRCRSVLTRLVGPYPPQ